MNYQEIEQYAINTGDCEFTDLLNECAKTLFKYNVPDWEEELGKLITTNSDDTECSIKDNIRANLESIINFLLRLNNLEVTELCLLTEKLEILNGLLSIEEYSDRQSIIDFIQADNNNEEKLCNILSLVTKYNDLKLMSLITIVDEDLIKQIAITLLPDNLEQAQDLAKQLDKQIKSYINLKKNIDNKELFSDKYFIDLQTVGLPINIYVNSYSKELPLLENKSLNINQVVLDLYGIICLSEEFSPVQELITKIMPLITNDPMISTEITVEISKLLIKVNNA